MKKIALFTVFACFMIILSGCGSSKEESTSYHKISAEEAKQMMENQEVVIVDVRTEEEYAQKHIDKAILVPNETIADEAKEKLPDKKAVYLVYCRSGNRSRAASEKLVEQGYEAVYDFGGINDWPYEVVESHE